MMALNESVAHILGSVRKKGVSLWLEDGQLRYKVPKGSLTPEDIELLKQSKAEIIALLAGAANAASIEPKSEQGRRLETAPLTFSQLAHWNVHQLRERCGMRHVASATRIQGRLDLNALDRSVAEIVRRHDALRTRIVVREGVPVQELSATGNTGFELIDLTAFSGDCLDSEIKHRIDEHILQPVEVSSDPLCGIRLLKLSDDEHVLVVAMEHIISDAYSLNLFSRELFEAYAQASSGQPFSLPPIPLQFSEYAAWRRNTHASWLERHGAYWDKHLSGCRRLRFPRDERLQAEPAAGWGSVPAVIDRQLKAQLSAWCRSHRTTLVMAVLTAYVAFVLRWCDAPEAVFPCQSDGRFDLNVENAIGYFASALYLRVGLNETDNFHDLLNRVREEYCRAYEHFDYSYLEAQVPQPEFVRNSLFNWVPGGHRMDRFDPRGSENGVTCTPVAFEHPMLRKIERDLEPSMLLMDSDEEVVGAVYFPLQQFSIATMQRFSANFLLFVRMLLTQPEKRIRSIPVA